MKKIVTAALSAVLLATLAACGSSGSITSPSNTWVSPTTPFSSSEPSVSPTTDPVVTPSETPSSGFTTTPFGTTGSFTQGDSGAFEATIGKPVKAKCQYQSIGCDKPETGDRVITVSVIIKNTGTEAISISSSNFVLEFADGTRMESGDGSASDYTPDTQVGYEQKIRPGATYKGTLTFEAPKGAFMVVMLTNSYDGDDLHGWS